MSIIKKLLSLVIIFIIVMNFFIGCTKKTNETAEVVKKIKIGVSLANASDKFWSYMLDEMKNYSKTMNDVEMVYADAKSDSNVQLSQVESFISQGVDVIAVDQVDDKSSQEIIDRAKVAKIPLISFNNPFISDDNTYYIGTDHRLLGISEMEYLAKKMNFKGNVAIIMGKMGTELQRLRTEAYHEVISKYPEMKIVAEQTADWNRSRGMALMQTWLESGMKIDAVASNSDEMAIGASNAIEMAGKTGKIFIGGIDSTPDALECLKSGKLSVTVFQDMPALARTFIDTAIKISKGEKVDKKILLNSELITPENVDEYIAKWKK